MKSVLSLIGLALAFLLSFNTGATILTVSNNPNVPAQYATFDAAYTVSRAGDTLLIAASANFYSATSAITKRLVIMGPGLNPSTAIVSASQRLRAQFSTISVDSNNFGAGHGTHLIGLVVSSSISLGSSGSARDVIITDCETGGIYAYNSTKNIVVKNCIFGTIYFVGNTVRSSVTVTNNIIEGTLYGARNRDLIANNLFIRNSAQIFSNVDGATIINNIFQGAAPIGAINSTFNNNLYFGTGATALPYGSNIGTNNINQDPLFAGASSTSTTFDNTKDYRLQAGSPGRNAGTDGTNIGPTGGSYPWYHQLSDNGQLPYVEMLNVLNPSVAPGGTLQVRVKAQKGR